MPGAWALAGRRLPVNGEARHQLVGASVHPPRPGGGTDADMVALFLYGQGPPRPGSFHDLRGTTVKLKPRAMVTRLRLDELNDVASVHGCSRVLVCDQQVCCALHITFRERGKDGHATTILQVMQVP